MAEYVEVKQNQTKQNNFFFFKPLKVYDGLFLLLHHIILTNNGEKLVLEVTFFYSSNMCH